MTAGFHQEQHELHLSNLIDQHPVGPDVAVPQTCSVRRERMVAVASGQRLLTLKHIDDSEELIQVETALFSPLEVLLALVRDDDLEHHRPRSLRRSATLR